ncbi:Phosphocholine cytidylyltransferase family protein OS=Streptomyces tendae OX=1932 GN=GUR47_02590 PE=4 SV=1 [Streptomyces tendae]
MILANGDTVHPVSVEKTLLAARGDGKKIILALDTVKNLADEEMKVVVDPGEGR